MQYPSDPRPAPSGLGASSHPEAMWGMIQSTGWVCVQLDFRAVRSQTSYFTLSFSFPSCKIGIRNATRQGSWEQ